MTDICKGGTMETSMENGPTEREKLGLWRKNNEEPTIQDKGNKGKPMDPELNHDKRPLIRNSRAQKNPK